MADCLALCSLSFGVDKSICTLAMDSSLCSMLGAWLREAAAVVSPWISEARSGVASRLSGILINGSGHRQWNHAARASGYVFLIGIGSYFAYQLRSRARRLIDVLCIFRRFWIHRIAAIEARADEKIVASVVSTTRASKIGEEAKRLRNVSSTESNHREWEFMSDIVIGRHNDKALRRYASQISKSSLLHSHRRRMMCPFQSPLLSSTICHRSTASLPTPRSASSSSTPLSTTSSRNGHFIWDSPDVVFSPVAETVFRFPSVDDLRRPRSRLDIRRCVSSSSDSKLSRRWSRISGGGGDYDCDFILDSPTIPSMGQWTRDSFDRLQSDLDSVQTEMRDLDDCFEALIREKRECLTSDSRRLYRSVIVDEEEEDFENGPTSTSTGGGGGGRTVKWSLSSSSFDDERLETSTDSELGGHSPIDKFGSGRSHLEGASDDASGEGVRWTVDDSLDGGYFSSISNSLEIDEGRLSSVGSIDSGDQPSVNALLARRRQRGKKVAFV